MLSNCGPPPFESCNDSFRRSSFVSQQIIILGTGGNCVDILEAILDLDDAGSERPYDCIGFLDDDPTKAGVSIHGVPVLGPLTDAAQFADTQFVNGIGSHTNFWTKNSIIARTDLPDDRFETIVHPSASVSRFASVGRGTAILQNVTVASGAQIGRHVVILAGSTINHDSVIGDFSSIASGVSVSGSVQVGHSSYLGTHCCIRDGVSVGDSCLIGMGSVVRHDVNDGSVVVGNPAKLLRTLHTGT
jgi:sugar O-acyltransferase (sialic acid O-acetyltransferase NeuD family)